MILYIAPIKSQPTNKQNIVRNENENDCLADWPLNTVMIHDYCCDIHEKWKYFFGAKMNEIDIPSTDK